MSASKVGQSVPAAALSVSPLGFAPNVLAAPATSASLHEATLNGSLNPNARPGSAWFEWGVTTNYGHVELLSSGLGSRPAPVSAMVTGPTSGVTYHYRLAASNDVGASGGADMTFLPAAPPSPETLTPTDVRGFFDETRATLRVADIPTWAPTWAWFESGPSVPCGNQTPVTHVGAGLQADLAGWPTGVMYQYRLVASNSAGKVFGLTKSFTAPGITLLGPRTITNRALRHNGTVAGWGRNGAVLPPLGLSNVIAIAGGPSANHFLALRRDGTVVRWDGYIGPPPQNLTIAIASGGNTSMALCAGGDVVAWGVNDYGQTDVPLDLAERARPVAVSGTVNPSVSGTYALTYRATNAQGAVATVTRTVVVTSQPVSISAGVHAGQLALDFQALPGSFYQIQASTNLTDWLELETGLVGDTGLMHFEDPAVSAFRSRFYRVIMRP